ncbi:MULTISPECIES: acyltransferase family protein [Serratia]|uniref:acyltransferase family protein n=1 Tax=Serratia TaxID=613 RepID=UPI00124D78D1|nr:acyltransferase [Serratia marcescens]QFH59620.1 acyltransferase [Serratia marcescens]QSD88890.1 acyltransferase [Serratia marcescens]
MENSASKKESKLMCLDSVRGIASLAVVLSHLSLIYFIYLHNFSGGAIPDTYPVQKYLHDSFWGFFYSGSSAVFVFFVMSGIVLSRGIEKKSDEYYLITSFTRYFRLAIPATFSCLLMLLVLLFISEGTREFPGVSAWLDPFLISDPSLIGAFTYGALGAFIGGSVWDGYIYNPVLWTMKIELIGSLFIYMACIVYKRSKWQSLSLFLLASLAIVPFSIPIALGMICFFFGFVYSAFNITYKNNYVGLVLLIIGLYFAGVHNDSVSYSWVTKLLGYRSYMFLNFLSGIFIVYGVLTSHSLSRMLENKGLVYLGKLSFPIYIIHMPMIILTIYLTQGFATASVASMLSVSAIAIAATLLLARFVVPVDDFSISFSKRVYNKIIGLRMVRRTE